MKWTSLFLTFIIFSACSDSEAEKERLEAELNEIKFAAPKLLDEGKQFLNAKDFTQARIKFETLIERHPDMTESIEAKQFLTVIDEEESYHKASSTENVGTVDEYLNRFPQGKYATNVQQIRKDLIRRNMEKAYTEAESGGTSYGWKKFLEEYPDHPKASAIERKIIQLEVDEIMGDSETGEMPSFESNGGGSSSGSDVQITNNTGCELTVRYSGSDVKMINIPVGSTRTVRLSSGSYRIAASACGANYAGTESLHGSYSSSFYISRSRF